MPGQHRVRGGGEIYLKCENIAIITRVEWEQQQQLQNILHKENMEEDRQIQIVTQNTAGVIQSILWLVNSNFIIQHLGPSFLTPDTITLLGVLSMIVLFIRKVRLSKSDVTLRTSGEAKIIILEEKGVLVPINFERKRHLKYSFTIQSKQYLILFIF